MRRKTKEQQQRPEDAAWCVKDVHFGIIEAAKSGAWLRFGWSLAVKNGTPRAQLFDVEVQFLDARGLVVDAVNLYRQEIAAQAEVMLSGDELISMPAAATIVRATAIATRRKR